MGAAPHNHTRRASQCLLELSIASLLGASQGFAEEAVDGPKTKAKKAHTAKPTRPPFKDGHTGLRNIFLGDEGGETTVQIRPPKSPERFNPDPGGNGGAAHTSATTDLPPPDPSPLFPPEPIMPREGPSGSLALPRRNVRGQTPINKVWE